METNSAVNYVILFVLISIAALLFYNHCNKQPEEEDSSSPEETSSNNCGCSNELATIKLRINELEIEDRKLRLQHDTFRQSLGVTNEQVSYLTTNQS